ncbi:MAG TPA: FAD-binding oxidoreductase [Acidimicrobiales bacterium]
MTGDVNLPHMNQPRMDLPHVNLPHMKWWGWGEEGVSFSHLDKPKLAPFVREKIGVDLDAPGSPPPDLASLAVPAPRADEALRGKLVAALGADWVRDDDLDRVVHGYGKSLRDLVRVRAGDFGRLPDLVVYPGSEADVEAVLAAVIEGDAVLVPFGGGTNIVGSLEAPRTESRPVVSLDLGRLDRVLELDADARLAEVEAGVLGPHLEAQLNARGWTLGHFPDSFTHSALGGWIATRSSGMQSDKYGDIADITRAVRVVTPAGVLVTRAVPSTSTGPSVREMVLGSEGRLGVITQATVQVHRLPEERTIIGYFYPDWSSALAAMQAIAASDTSPSVTRVSDADETQFSLSTSKAGSLVSKLQSAGLKQFLKRVKGFDLDRACLSFVGFEGGPDHVKAQRKAVGRIVSQHGGLAVGTGPGQLYDQKKFDTPYIRDYLLDRGGFADVSETSAPWSRLDGLHTAVRLAAGAAFERIGVTGFVMCHLSHSYHSGACLYFTFAFRPRVAGADGGDMAPLDQYDVVKAAIQQAFVDNGATLSHHHAVGVEHARWLAEDISPVGVTMIRVLLDGIDPDHRLNPDKIVPR